MYAFFAFVIFQPFLALLAYHISLDLSHSLETIIDDCRNFKAHILQANLAKSFWDTFVITKPKFIGHLMSPTGGKN